VQEYAVFRTSEYSWPEHGCAFMNRFYPRAAELLDTEFGVAFDLTYNTLGVEQRGLETGPYRRAIW
jgi:hypothetical protein